MSETITGTFEELIKVKTGKGKKGPWTLWNIKVDGNRYGAGFDQPKAAVGDQVEFETEENENGYQEIVKGTFKVTKAATKEESAATKAKTSAETSEKQSSIEAQTALKAAVDLVNGFEWSSFDEAVAAIGKAYKACSACLAPLPKVEAAKTKPAAKKPAAPPPADEDENQDPDY